ncbi:MAG TPA: hypothetical protein VMA53_06525 [Stellaceae bacterium]|nr:hypothetical protein [Stellaceae bacterium]
MYGPEVVGRLFRLTMAMTVVLTLAALSARAADQPSAAPMAVETTGWVPGFGEADLGRYVAEQMNAARVGWQFAAVPNAAAQPNRVEWSFTTGPSASGAVRTYGFSRATMERLMPTRYYVTVEAKLYWHGQYQTVMLGHVTTGTATPDPDLTALIGKMTRLVMAYPMSENERRPGIASGAGAVLVSSPPHLP